MGVGIALVGRRDSYGYISQADAWLSGQLVVPQPFFDQHPPPFSRLALAPLGWRSEVDGYGMVPRYSVGYPLMLAAAKRIGGHSALFVVVPLCVGLLVWMTYVLGVVVGRPSIGLLAAMFVATSPTVLFMGISPMSDVPSAALWTTAMVLTISGWSWAPVVAGAVTALAILVRPNLLPLAALCALWLFWRDVQSDRVRRPWLWRVLWFAVPASIGALVNARINAWWFGSPWQSGYGDLGAFFAWSHLRPNARHYAGFLWRAETPLAFGARPLRFLRHS